MPRYGDVVCYNNCIVYVGTIPVFGLLKRKITGKRIIKWWMGTDVLTLCIYPPYYNRLQAWLHRVKMWLLRGFIDEHWFVCEKLRCEIPDKYVEGKTEIAYLRYPFKVYPKKDHEGFNVLYYAPAGKFHEWLYGLDLIRWLINKYPELGWVKVNGSQNMDEIYPIIDLYIRPSRDDGAPKMVDECEAYGIPVYWSEDGYPEFHDICAFIDKHTSVGVV